jgi:hypothetical protein
MLTEGLVMDAAAIANMALCGHARLPDLSPLSNFKQSMENESPINNIRVISTHSLMII